MYFLLLGAFLSCWIGSISCVYVYYVGVLCLVWSDLCVCRWVCVYEDVLMVV